MEFEIKDLSESLKDLLFIETFFSVDEDINMNENFEIFKKYPNFVVEQITHFYIIRPFLRNKLLIFCKFLLNNIFQDSLIFKNYLLEKGLLLISPLIYQLAKENYFKYEEICNLIDIELHFLASIIFIEHLPNFSELIKKYSNIKYWIPRLKILLENNGKILFECIEYGFPKDSIFYCIKYDDINLLHQFLNQNNFNFNEEIDLKTFDFCYEYNNYRNLLEFAASFGSFKCFNLLLIKNKFEITYQLLFYAIQGGNYEMIQFIINSLEINSLFLNNLFNNIGKFRRNKLFKFFI